VTGRVVAWGRNNKVQLNIHHRATDGGVVHLSAGQEFTLALLADEQLVGWGR
jgi:alpha-tubulin suppressor-like RCC1 family protein